MPIELDNVGLNKIAIIERSIRRAREEYALDPSLTSYTHIDALVLNIERACQAAIDLAMRIIARDRLGMPQTSADAFRLLHKSGLLSKRSAQAMIAMTGFRNVAVHEYQSLDMEIVRAIVETRWHSLVEFCAELGGIIQP